MDYEFTLISSRLHFNGLLLDYLDSCSVFVTRLEELRRSRGRMEEKPAVALASEISLNKTS